jgi:hypothetical protein
VCHLRDATVLFVTRQSSALAADGFIILSNKPFLTFLLLSPDLIPIYFKFHRPELVRVGLGVRRCESFL